MRETVNRSAGLGPLFVEPHRSVVGLFARPRSAERALRALLAGVADLATISVVTQHRRPHTDAGDHSGGDGADADGLLGLALDGDLGRRIGAGVLAVGYPQAIVVVGALATRLSTLARGTSGLLGETLVAGGIPRLALPSYLAALGAGQAMITVGLALPARERHTRHAFARHGAGQIRSYPLPLPRRSPEIRADTLVLPRSASGLVLRGDEGHLAQPGVDHATLDGLAAALEVPEARAR